MLKGTLELWSLGLRIWGLATAQVAQANISSVVPVPVQHVQQGYQPDCIRGPVREAGWTISRVREVRREVKPGFD